MTKRVGFYKRRKQLREDLAEYAEEIIGAGDIEGAEARLHARHVVVSIDKILSAMFQSMTSEEQHDVIKSGL